MATDHELSLARVDPKLEGRWSALIPSCAVNEAPQGISQWLEQKRRTGRITAAVISVLALGGGGGVFLLTSLLIFALLSIACGVFIQSKSVPAIAALCLTVWLYAHIIKRRQQELDLYLDPMGFWIIKDISSVGPRLILEGLRQVRACADLGELNVAACARALAYLARQNAAVKAEDLIRQCPELSWARLRKQLLWLDGVLFLGEDALRVTLMEPFRLRLRSMLGPEPSTAEPAYEPGQSRSQPPPRGVPVSDPEKLSAYEILGLTPAASLVEIKAAYRKRVKACHPDLFADTDQEARALAERWTKALNAAYATLNPRQRPEGPRFASQR